MNKKQITNTFLHRLEFYFRNFGGEWNINDFVDKANKDKKEILIECLLMLESKGIVKILTDNFDFKIMDLPSKYESL